MLRRNFPVLLVALLSLGFLSGQEHDGARKIACVDPTSPEALFDNASTLALQNDLFGRVKTEAQQEIFKQRSLEIYNFLTQNELRYYFDAQAANAAYGIKGPLFNGFMPTSVAQAGQFGMLGFMPTIQMTNLWGNMFQPQPIANLPGLMGSMSPIAQMSLTAPPQPGLIQPANIAPLKSPQVSISAVPAPVPSLIRF